MRTRFLPILVVLTALALTLVSEATFAQDLHPSRRLSPIGIARTHIGDTYVKVTYGRPYVRNRKIFGANTDSTKYLVPFGQIWRTGASEATEITVTGPVMLAGHHLDAGTYSIFTEPGSDSWVIHISSLLGLDGTGIFDADAGVFTPKYTPDSDVLAFSVPVHKLPEDEPVDQFTISFDDTGMGADMVLRWEWTEVRVPIGH
ncbi:MAG: DUF2911 domain-containing protein [Rhodothermales bacterium]